MNPKRSVQQSAPALPLRSGAWSWRRALSRGQRKVIEHISEPDWPRRLAGGALVTFGVAVLLSNLCGAR